MSSLAAEIAYVSQRRAVALAVLDEHPADPFGVCRGCGDRRWPCSRVTQAQRVRDWAERRAHEINVVLDATVALHAPTMLLAQVSVPVTAPHEEGMYALPRSRQ